MSQPMSQFSFLHPEYRTFSLQRRLALAHEISTDVFELQLFDISRRRGGEYSDRYLKSSLTMRLIYEIMRAAPGLSKSTTLRLSTASNTRSANGGYPSKLFHDWVRDADREGVTRSLMERISSASSVDFTQRTDLSHARVLSLAYPKSKVQIYLDRGVGFWRMNASEPLDFTRDTATQAQKLLQSTAAVSGDRNKPMPVWLRRN